MNKKIVIGAVSAFALLLLVGCKDDAKVKNKTAPAEDATLDSIDFTAGTGVLYIPNTVDAKAEGQYSNDSVDDILASVTLSSSDTSVVTITADGVVQAVGVGAATLTAEETESGVSGSLDVTVPGWAVPATGGVTSLTGSIDSADPTYTRMQSNCTTPYTGPFHYDTFIVGNQTGSDQTVDINAIWNQSGTSSDGYLFAYDPSFNPVDPAAGCVLGNDDNLSTLYSKLSNFLIPDGEERIIVATTYVTATVNGPWAAHILSTPSDSALGQYSGFDAGTLAPWVATGLWHLSTYRLYGGAYSARYSDGDAPSDDYDTGSANSGTLTSPAFTVSGLGKMDVEYVLLTEVAPGNNCSGVDCLTVDISTDDGASWTQLDEFPATSASFLFRRVNLSAYLGQSVRVRFVFDTFDSVGNFYEGAYVDQVMIY